MTRSVPGWPKCPNWGRSCCSPCPRPSSLTAAPGLAWQSPACFPPLPLPSPSLCSMLTVWSFLANWRGLFRSVFVQLWSSRPSIYWPWEVSRLCGVAHRLLHLSAPSAFFISLSLVCMVQGDGLSSMGLPTPSSLKIDKFNLQNISHAGSRY